MPDQDTDTASSVQGSVSMLTPRIKAGVLAEALPYIRRFHGRTIVVNQRDLGGIRENTYVRVVNGRVVLR